MAGSAEHRISFSPEDVAVFSAASHDRSPLHLSDEYARKTPYGQPVLFGVLTGLASIGHIQPRPFGRIARVVMEFAKPMFAGIEYSLQVAHQSDGVARARVYDGRHLTLKTTVEFRDEHDESRPGIAAPVIRGSQTAQLDKLTPGFQTHATYMPAWEHVAAVMNRLGLIGKGIDEQQVAALMWCSHFVGMELPDSRGLVSGISLEFERSHDTHHAPLDCRATVLSFDQRFDRLKIGVAFGSNCCSLASGEVTAFVRQDVSAPEISRVVRLLPASRNLEGKVALVMGGSRGLGAVIVQFLSLQGCKVLVGYHKSTAAAAALKESLSAAPGEVSLVQGDAANVYWCEELKHRIVRAERKLDFLICTAGPALLPYWLEPRTIDRINEHVNRSFALVSVPMAVFLDELARNGGWNVVVSSSAVRRAVTEWPHYVSAKHAIEGLVKVAAQQYQPVNFLLVRPPRLLTDLTNTPLGREGATPPEKVAAKIVKRLSRPSPATRLNMLSDFR